MVELVRLANEDPGSLNILLTGRKMTKFVICISAMVTSKKLPFHAIVLRKGDAENTLAFKIEVMRDLLTFYTGCQEITVYDDRPSQADGFRRFFKQFQAEHRRSLLYDVVDCLEETRYLDPVLERDLVIGVLEAHNEAVQKRYLSSYVSNGQLILKRVFFNLSYRVDAHCTKRLLEILVPHVAERDDEAQDLDYHCDNMVITRRQDTQLQEQLGGLNHADTWKIIQIGHVPGRIWALRLAPENNVSVVTEKTPPELVIATSRAKNMNTSKITNWELVEGSSELAAAVVSTRIKEDILYRIEPKSNNPSKGHGRNKKAGRPAKKDKSVAVGSYY